MRFVYMQKRGRVGINERVSNTPWVQIQYGFCFWVQPCKEHKLDVSLYAQIDGGKIDSEVCFCKKSGLDIFNLLKKGSKKSELVTFFKEKIGEAIQKTIDNKLVNNDLQKQLADILKNQLKK